MSSHKLYDVIISGAGPVGLYLACELSLARASVLVLERDAEAVTGWKTLPLGMRGLNTSSAEAFYRRGMLDRVFQKRAPAFEKTGKFQSGGHFAGLFIDANKLELQRWKYRLNGPALVPAGSSLDKIEGVLEERAKTLGVTILRGHPLIRIAAQEDDSVTVEVENQQFFRGRWLVGCDGARSVVRKAAGIPFEGTEAKFTGYSISCDWDHPENIKPGFHMGPGGMYIFAGPAALYMTDFDDGAYDRTQELTLEHAQSVFEQVSGATNLKMQKIKLGSTFTDQCKQASSYRKGRILLAGDAAHIHGPVGSQGMNLGLGDAINLGWKLAATIRQEQDHPGTVPDLTLLETYQSERQPMVSTMLEWIRTQVSTMRPDAYSQAMRGLMREFLNTTDGANMAMDRQWGLSQRLNIETGAHELVGASAPDFEFADGSRLGAKLESGKALLVDLDFDSSLKGAIENEQFKARVQYVRQPAKSTCGLGAILVRPDGVVAWVAELDAKPDMEALEKALDRWFTY